MNSAEMSLIPWEAQRIAERMLADYDAHRPNEIFAERALESGMPEGERSNS